MNNRLTIVIVLSLLLTTGAVLASGIGSLSVGGDTQGNKGQDVFVLVNAQNVVGVENMAFDFLYNASVLSAYSDGVSAGNLVNGSFSRNIDSADGIISISINGINNGNSGSLASIKFKVIGDINSVGDLSISNVNINGNSANIPITNAQFKVIDNTPPTISGIQNMTTKATGNLTPVSLGNVTCSDVDSSCTLSNNAPANNEFPIGTTTIAWTATDPSGNTATVYQSVTITDTTPPVINAKDIKMEATGDIPDPNGNLTTVNLGGTCTDFESCTLSNNAPNGFPVGVTIVTWNAIDPSGNTATANQSVTITDTTGPTLFIPNDTTAEATGPLTKVNIGNATAIDLVDPHPVIINDAPVAGFPLGNTAVTWQAKDKFGNPSLKKLQIITIKDTTPPNLTVPSNIITIATGNLTKLDIGNATAADLVDPNPKITNNAPPDRLFPIGNTTVTWTATDFSNNSATAVQYITVRGESGVGLIVVPQSIKVNPNETANYNITINNTGLVTDNFSLVLNNVNNVENMNLVENMNVKNTNENMNIENMNILLNPGENRNVGLVVSDHRPGTYVTYITATSLSNSSKNATVTAVTEVVTTNTGGGGGPSAGGGGTSSSGGGGGGGGGGVLTAEPFANIYKSETREMDLSANVTITYTFTTPDIAIYEADIIDTYSENGVSLRIEVLKSRSNSTAKLAQGLAYKYINAQIGLDPSKIKKVVFRYKVNNSWLGNNSVTPDNIKLFKWSNKWIGLPTKVIKNDANYTYFESESDSLASFAIVGLSSAIPTTPIITPTPIPPITPEATIPFEANQPVATISLQKKSPGFDGILAIGVMILTVIIFSRKRKK